MNLISKKERVLDLVFVIFITCFPSIFFSIYAMIFGQTMFNFSNLNHDLTFLNSIIGKLLSIYVLLYIFYKQGRTIREIGYSFSLKDIIHSILLVMSAYIIYSLFYSFLYPLFQNVDIKPRNIEIFKGKLTIFYFLAMVINPWYEELILRAYLISEVKWLTDNVILAVFVSIFIQILGHLYQGLIAALLVSIVFFVFSLYYVITNKITPIVIAHLFFDILAMGIYASR